MRGASAAAVLFAAVTAGCLSDMPGSGDRRGYGYGDDAPPPGADPPTPGSAPSFGPPGEPPWFGPTVRQDVPEMCRLATEHLLALLELEDPYRKAINFRSVPPRLVIRASTQAVAEPSRHGR